MNQILKPETAGAVFGVPVRFNNVIGEPGASTVRNQTAITERRPCPAYGPHAFIQAELRFDDNCGNGHNSFALTATIHDSRYKGDRGWLAGGCCHEDIAAVFPELAPLIKWHLTSTDDPMHYLANTLYHASDRDHNGLLKGEKRQIRNGKTGALCWELVVINSEGVGISSTPTGDEYRRAETVPLFILQKHCEGDAPPLATPKMEWRPLCRVGEGKERNFAAARHSAVWPEATDEQLTAPREELKAALEARLPALLAAFKADMLAAGFMWTE